MKHVVRLNLAAALLASVAAGAFAQDRIYRCGNEYLNNAKDAQARGCKVVDGGNVTVVQGTSVQSPQGVKLASTSSQTAKPAARAPVTSSSSPEQRARDSEARSILEAELKKAESRLAEQLREFNNGEPEKQGIEGRNYQRYLDRVAEMKEGIARNQSDISGLKREIGRLPGGPTVTQ